MTAPTEHAPPSHGKPRAVLDTNVVLSALLFRQGRLSALRSAWQSGAFIPVVSRQTLEELTRVLAYPKFRLTAADVSSVMETYLPYVEAHTSLRAQQPLPSIIPVCRDPKDQMFLELAHSAAVDCLVTGDEDLLALNASDAATGAYKILNPMDFLSALAPGRTV